MLKREWGAESNGKLPHQFISNETATLVPEFVVEDLPLGRTAALVPEFAVEDLPLTEHSDDDDDDDIFINIYFFSLNIKLLYLLAGAPGIFSDLLRSV